MGKKKCPECPKGAPKWMTTFSDLTTLLLTFFVLLITMATFDKVKMDQVFSVLTGSRGILNMPATSQMSQQNIVARQAVSESVEKSKEKVEKVVKEFIQAQNLEKMISVVKTEKGISIRIMDSVFFNSGSSTLLPIAFPVLNKLLVVLHDTPFYVNVEGHTDDEPIGRRALTNWDLSVMRAVSIVKFFIAQGFDPVKLSASGFGEFHPILPNITPENRAKNRRVEINIVTPEFAETGRNILE